MVLGQPTDEAVDDPDRISCRDRTVAVFAQPRRLQVDAVPEWPRPQIAARPATVHKIIQRHSFLFCDECRGAASNSAEPITAKFLESSIERAHSCTPVTNAHIEC